MLVITAQSAK